MISEDVWTRVGGTQRNLMRLFFHPNGVKPFVTNWTAIAPLLWQRAHREAAAEALGGQEMKQVLSELSQYQNADTLWAAEDAALVPVLPLEIAKDSMRISLFTVIATFGTAQDVTADELWIESLFPADEATECFSEVSPVGERFCEGFFNTPSISDSLAPCWPVSVVARPVAASPTRAS